MDAQAVQTRLTQAILVANTGPSVEVGENFVHAGRVTIEFASDRVTIRDRMKLFANPGSIALLFARFDEPGLEEKVGRFLQKKGVDLPAKWLEVMDAKTIQRRLAQALMIANPTSSVSIDGESYIRVGLFTIELGSDQVVIGPSGNKLTADELKLLGDPDSVVWLMFQFNHPKFASKIARFLQQHGISLPERWLD